MNTRNYTVGKSRVLFLCAILFGGLSTPVSAIEEKDSRDAIVEPEMVRIPGGTFAMGTADGEGDERPVHQVTLSPYLLGKREVTVKQFRAYCEALERPMPEEPPWGWRDDHPVVNVSWGDAQRFARWLEKETGKPYRLPTEAEYEFAARDGGKVRKYPWGGGKPTGNVSDESARAARGDRVWEGYDDGYEFVAPVGSFPPNSLGLHDLDGNVWEWCADRHGEYPSEDQTDPKGPTSGRNRVGRGPSYDADPWHSRVASRNFVPPTFLAKSLGFRLALDAESDR